MSFSRAFQEKKNKIWGRFLGKKLLYSVFDLQLYKVILVLIIQLVRIWIIKSMEMMHEPLNFLYPA